MLSPSRPPTLDHPPARPRSVAIAAIGHFVSGLMTVALAGLTVMSSLFPGEIRSAVINLPPPGSFMGGGPFEINSDLFPAPVVFVVTLVLALLILTLAIVELRAGRRAWRGEDYFGVTAIGVIWAIAWTILGNYPGAVAAAAAAVFARLSREWFRALMWQPDLRAQMTPKP
jgi:hypothetical protein